MSIVEKRSGARRADYVARNERMFAATCISVEILVAALADYVLGLAILLQAPGASPSQSKVPGDVFRRPLTAHRGTSPASPTSPALQGFILCAPLGAFVASLQSCGSIHLDNDIRRLDRKRTK
jgi:hypothetical protein